MSNSSIWPIHRALSGATTPGQSGSGNSGNEGILSILQSSSITGASPSNCLMSYPGHSLRVSYSCAEMQLVYSTAPANWVIYKARWVNCCHFKLMILLMYFICFRFCLLCSKLDSVEQCLWRKQHHDAIHSSRNLKTACCAAWHSCQKLQYKYSSVWVSIWRDSYSYWRKPNTQYKSWCFREVTSNSEVIPSFILTLNKMAYIKYLEEIKLSWIDRHDIGTWTKIHEWMNE